jgi:hypothetical protein
MSNAWPLLNATQIASQLRFLLQLRALEIPVVVALTMSDESRRFGIAIDAGGLGEALGLPVLAVSARRNQGIHALIDSRPWSRPCAASPMAGQPPHPPGGLVGSDQRTPPRWCRVF